MPVPPLTNISLFLSFSFPLSFLLLAFCFPLFLLIYNGEQGYTLFPRQKVSIKELCPGPELKNT